MLRWHIKDIWIEGIDSTPESDGWKNFGELTEPEYELRANPGFDHEGGWNEGMEIPERDLSDIQESVDSNPEINAFLTGEDEPEAPSVRGCANIKSDCKSLRACLE